MPESAREPEEPAVRLRALRADRGAHVVVAPAAAQGHLRERAGAQVQAGGREQDVCERARQGPVVVKKGR